MSRTLQVALGLLCLAVPLGTVHAAPPPSAQAAADFKTARADLANALKKNDPTAAGAAHADVVAVMQRVVRRARLRRQKAEGRRAAQAERRYQRLVALHARFDALRVNSPADLKRLKAGLGLLDEFEQTMVKAI